MPLKLFKHIFKKSINDAIVFLSTMMKEGQIDEIAQNEGKFIEIGRFLFWSFALTYTLTPFPPIGHSRAIKVSEIHLPEIDFSVKIWLISVRGKIPSDAEIA